MPWPKHMHRALTGKPLPVPRITSQPRVVSQCARRLAAIRCAVERDIRALARAGMVRV